MSEPRSEYQLLRERVIDLARRWDEESVEPAEDFADALLDLIGFADALLDLIGLDPFGYLWRPYQTAVWRHTPVDQDWDDLSRHEPLEHHAVYRLAPRTHLDPEPDVYIPRSEYRILCERSERLHRIETDQSGRSGGPDE